MKRCEEPRGFAVKTEIGKAFRRNSEHLRQVADSNGTDDPIFISDGEEENSVEQEDIPKYEEVNMDPSNKVNVPHRHNLSNEVTT